MMMQPYDDGLRLHHRNVFESRVQDCHIKRCNDALQKVAQVHPYSTMLQSVFAIAIYRRSGIPVCAKVDTAHVAATWVHNWLPGQRASPGREPSTSHGRWAPAPVPCSSGVAQLPRQCCRKISAVAHTMLQGVA